MNKEPAAASSAEHGYIPEINVSKLRAHKRGELLSFYKPTLRKKTKKVKTKQRNAVWELKFQQDGVRVQQAFEAEIRYLNRLYYGKSFVRI